MIDKFKVFELNYDTYNSASQKAKQLGHYKKSKRLRDWSLINTPATRISEYTPFELGKVSLSLNKYTNKNTPNKPPVYVSEQEARGLGGLVLVEEGPYEGYISSIWIDEHTFERFDDPSEEISYIPIVCSFILLDKSGSVVTENNDDYPIDSSFSIYITIDWIDNEFKISSEDADITQFSGDYVTIFSNRKDALKFKNMLKDLNKYSKWFYDKLRSFFLEYSSAKEWNRFTNKLNSIPVNKLYRD